MAGPKKKKSKPAANPARGFATTSVASKPRVETATTTGTPPNGSTTSNSVPASVAKPDASLPPSAAQPEQATPHAQPEPELSPEEFERQLEESELQLLVEKYAQKVRRDATRQRTRLDTDRRLLRGQAEPLNTRKWLPQELMDQILDLIQAESRFTASSLASERSPNEKMLAEEDLTMRLWTLQQTLRGLSFSSERIAAVLQYILEVAPSVSSANRDYIWGLEEALDWLAKSCDREELRDYDHRSVRPPKSQPDTPYDSPLPSGANTPRLVETVGTGKHGSSKNGLQSSRAGTPRKLMVTCDEDFEPEDLIPAYLKTMEKLFWLQRPKQGTKKPAGTKNRPTSASRGQSLGSESSDLEEAKLLAKIDRIEQDVLFDKPLAEHMWRNRRIELEKEYASNARKAEQEMEREQEREKEREKETQKGGLDQVIESDDDDDDIAKEAKRMAAEILQNDSSEDEAISDLFANLPVQETDATGKTSTVINGANGVKVTIRDFGKWSGVNPTRALEEACRSRDSTVKIAYSLISESSFSNRHMVSISWSKPQESVAIPEIPCIEQAISPQHFSFKMATVSTPDSKQSEAYIATVAMFSVFGSTKEEKIFLRLPAVWRELWSELAEEKKNQADAVDRVAIKELRTMIRRRQDQELEDGVLLHGAFRGRAAQRVSKDGDDPSIDRSGTNAYGPEYYQKIWFDKASTPRFQAMLQSRMQLPMWQFRQQVLETVEREQVVIVCGETGW
ncbi:hypothetical protein F5Y09DRAFT_319127 [Xylaria sp. FL1042]|nr:hypothetical protein F5Y09DRAFT_319127 [Xylaria sp. FL1042]